MPRLRQDSLEYCEVKGRKERNQLERKEQRETKYRQKQTVNGNERVDTTTLPNYVFEWKSATKIGKKEKKTMAGDKVMHLRCAVIMLQSCAGH